MALRVDYEGSNDVGVFCRLTNSYCLVGVGATQNFYRLVLIIFLLFNIFFYPIVGISSKSH